jgi:hypothetical protein
MEIARRGEDMKWTIGSLTSIVSLLCWVGVVNAQSNTVLFELRDAYLETGALLSGVFSWTYGVGDFENGVGEFLGLDVPYTTHDETDLGWTIDVTSSVEITLPGGVHDDGVDITLVLAAPLTPTSSVPLVIGAGESKYEIGGNGFNTGLFSGGRISPAVLQVQIEKISAAEASIFWLPDIPGVVLQERPSLDTSSWTNTPGGTTNPVVVPIVNPAMFYRAVKP